VARDEPIEKVRVGGVGRFSRKRERDAVKLR